MSTADEERKRLETLAARAALMGIACNRIAAGDIVMAICGGGWIFPDVPCAELWLREREATEEQPMVGG